MSITKETRRAAYHEVLETLGKRHKLILEGLKGGELTANELAMKLWKEGTINTPDRNRVHPRLNEMVESGVVEVVDKRKCSVSGKTCATYKIKKPVAPTTDQETKISLEL